MTDGRCDYCDDEFEEGQNILIHTSRGKQVEFCGSICAGAYLVESSCASITYSED